SNRSTPPLPLTSLFSSRRRHTTFSRDWSSDVCSSDLTAALPLTDFEPSTDDLRALVLQGLSREQKVLPTAYLYDEQGSALFERKIGRASCREGVGFPVGVGPVEKAPSGGGEASPQHDR